MPGKRWTDQEVSTLRRYIGYRSMDWLAIKLGKTPNAVWCKAYQLNISAKHNRTIATPNSYSLVDLIRDTGYNWKQLNKAKIALNQEWRQFKKSAGAKFYITKKQKKELLRYLAKPGPKRKNSNYWSPKFRISNCLNCGTNKRKHYIQGLCERCFSVVSKHTVKYKYHKLLVAYWRLATVLDIPPSPLHPIDQLNLWNSCADTKVWQIFCTLNFNII